MKTVNETGCEYFEHLLWQNELEFNSRELAIFESFLLNREKHIPVQIYADYMAKIHELLRSSNKILTDLKSEKEVSKNELLILANTLIEKQPTATTGKVENPYLLEEMFYYKQSYREFKKQICSFVGGLKNA